MNLNKSAERGIAHAAFEVQSKGEQSERVHRMGLIQHRARPAALRNWEHALLGRSSHLFHFCLGDFPLWTRVTHHDI